MKLAELQALLYRLITAPGGVAEGLVAERGLPPGGLEELIVGDARMAARERVAIYADAYFYRLLEVLREDYAATLAVVGETAFHNLVTGYLAAYPPTARVIQEAGRALPDYLRRHPLNEARPYLAELAAFERALSEVFQAADGPALEAAALGAVAPHAWGALRLRTHPAVRVLRCEWKVAETYRSYERGEGVVAAARGRHELLISRKDDRVFYRELEAGEGDALRLAMGGTTFGAMCEVIAAARGDAEVAAVISRLLGSWIAAGVLSADAPA
jgi:hypothetical protein